MNRRRDLLKGVLALPLATSAMFGASATPAMAALSANDSSLIEIADELEALERECNAHTASHPSKNRIEADEDDFNALTEGFLPLEDEIAETPADTMVGILAKARAMQVPTVRQGAVEEVFLSIADDLHRLFGEVSVVDRRTFLQGLASLPLIGGAVTLIGNPTAAAVPLSDGLLRNYEAWLAWERFHLHREIFNEDVAADNAGFLAVNLPGERWHNRWRNGDVCPQPSTRAAVILSAAGVPLVGGCVNG